MKKLEIDGVIYDEKLVDEIIKLNTQFRATVLAGGCFKEAILISHNIALLNTYKAEIQKKDDRSFE